VVTKKHIALFQVSLLFTLSLFSQVDSSKQKPVNGDTILQRIVLIGDAGELTGGKHPVVDAVKSLIKLDKKTTVLYLGDNLYKVGLPDEESRMYSQTRAVLDTQININTGNDARVIMIPGNHDWENGGRGGYDAVMREQLYVNFKAKKDVSFVPEDGCPGPIEIPLGSDVVLVLFDSQWWLHPHEKPEVESDCACKTKEELTYQLEEMTTRNSKKLVILGCHHPFKTYGTHGGYYPLKQHIFPLTDMRKNLYIPLPVIGSIYPLSRSFFGTPQDLRHPTYQDMVTKVSEAVKATPNLIFVAGHDHNLQHIVDSNRNYLVSGGGCKINRSSTSKHSKFNSTSTGFAVLEVSINKNVNVDFYVVADTGVTKAYSAFLLNFSKVPETATDTLSAVKTDDPFLKYKDTVTVPARSDLVPISGLKKFFMGQNYRKEWSTPVNMKVFNLKKEGMTITGLGGGRETKSLRLKDAKGKEWTLRSLNRSSAKAIPEGFRGTLAKDLITELNSAAFPYGALTFPKLAEALDINVPHPTLYFVPDDPALGFHRPLFKDNVCMLEEKDASWDGKDTKLTGKVIQKMLQENDHRPAYNMLLQARLLDILTADFDRHFDQWRWGEIDTGKGKLYYPIPRDRDQSYFYSDGAVLNFVARKTLPFLKGFRNNIPDPIWLGYNSRDFDRLFLPDLDEEEWKDKIADFKARVTDSVIRAAVHDLPKEIYPLVGETFIKKMISRRDKIDQAALQYYRFISQKVNVLGSNQKEYFRISNHGAGLQVRVYARAKGNDTSFIMYDRIFDPAVTREVHLYGLNDDDLFEIDSSAHSRIKLRIIGGKGNDTFDMKGTVENMLYDIASDKNYIKDSSHSKKRFSSESYVNEQSIRGFEYNQTRYPRFHYNYNADDGSIIGAGISRRTYGFRNPPYASDQRLMLLYSLDRRAFQANYRGEFNHITRDYDLLVHANFAAPDLVNYFGLGNYTIKDPAKDYSFYRTRYRYFDLETMIRKRLFTTAHVMAGLYYYHYNAKLSDNINKILGQPGVDPGIYKPKNYAGIKFGFLVDNRNKEFFPTRGVYWFTEFSGLKGITDGSKNLIKYTTDMTIYASLTEAAKLVAVLKMGGGKIYNKNFEYFQALSLGANNTLSGFRKNRFTGGSLIYYGLDLKQRLFDINSFILPGPFGVNAFFEGGRVWQAGEHSNVWHRAFGVGIFYMPFNLFAINGTIGFSKEEKMVIFNVGTKINLIW
jgi:hypothetical protein